MTPFAVDLSAWLVAEHGLRPADITAETPLFSTQVLDSLALVDLLEWVERRSGVRVKWSDVNLDNLDTVARIEAYVDARR